MQSTVKWAKQLEFDPKNIIFEVIESDHVDDLDHLKRILDFYKSQGFMVALDDVGSGYSSLNMIAKLLPNIVKIDRAIIDQIDTNEVNQSIFRAITQIAHENGIGTLDEHFIYNDGEKLHRTWTMKPDGEKKFIATAGDIVGDAHMEARGNTVMIDYVMRIPYGNGTLDIDVRDWLHLQDDGVIINHSKMKKFGIEVGELVITIIKEG